MTRHVILGAGVAGLTAAETIRATDNRAEITLVSDDPFGFYSRPGLAYYLTGELPEEQLYIYTKEDWRKLNLRFVQARATRLLPDEHQLELGSNGMLSYDRLLLATGASALRLDIPGQDLQGVVSLDNLEDARRILQLARHASSAVVVGGGITALELAEGLAARRVHVHYFLRGKRYWPSVLDEQESGIIEQHLRHDHIQLHHHTELAALVGKRGKLKAVRTTDGKQVDCQLVAIAIGTQARTALARQAGLEIEKGILTDQYLQTSQPDIYAAGDCAQVYDPARQRALMQTLWNSARDQGKAAGLNMAGIVTPFDQRTALNVTRLGGLTVTLIGAIGGGRDEDMVSISRGDSEDWRASRSGMTLYQSADVNRVRLILGQKAIFGALVMGDQTLSRPLQHLIDSQADISSIKARLLQPQADLRKLILELWQSAGQFQSSSLE